MENSSEPKDGQTQNDFPNLAAIQTMTDDAQETYYKRTRENIASRIFKASSQGQSRDVIEIPEQLRSIYIDGILNDLKAKGFKAEFASRTSTITVSWGSVNEFSLTPIRK